MDKEYIYLTGGIYNRRKIVNYSLKTRPTSQKVRLAVFNMLYNISGIGLDLFAGSGAYAFEALSRGASLMYINDNNGLAIKSINENAKTLDVIEKVKITKYSYMDALKYYNDNNIMFDYVFIDPPYDFTDEAIIEILNYLNKTQKKGLKVVLERNNNSSLLNVCGFNLLTNKAYGSKKIFIYQKS